MTNGGMVQAQHEDGSWHDVIIVSYLAKSVALEVSRDRLQPVRIIKRDGRVVFSHDPEENLE